MSGFAIRQARRDVAVPPGRIGYRIDADPVLVHTIQSAAAFDRLLSAGALEPDTDLAEPGFADAYQWMYGQMAARLSTSGAGALWFWARTRRAYLVDNCRNADKGDVLLTCRMPRERLLLSHFDDWHMALNEGFHAARLPGETNDTYFARWEQLYDEFHGRVDAAGLSGVRARDWPADLRRELQASWEPIFDPASYGRYEIWQATARRLFASDVIEAVVLE